MKKLRIAFVGCGRIAEKHLAVVKELASHLTLVAVCDQDPQKAKAFGEGAGVPYYTDHHSLLSQHPLDLISILTWSGNHAALARDCTPYVPNLIVEKPLALRLEDADALIEKCEKENSRLFVVKQNRYNPPVQHLKKAVETGRFGKLFLGTVRVRWCRPASYYQDSWRGTWAWDGGVFTNQASHHIDLLTWLMGPVESVFAKAATFLAPIEAEDTGVAILKFQSGALGIIEATTCARPNDLEGSLSLLGEKGSVEIDGFAVNRMKTWAFSIPLLEDAKIRKTDPESETVFRLGHLCFYRDAIQCIREGRVSMIDGQEGRKSLELLNALYESVETRKEVFLNSNPRVSQLGKATTLPFLRQ